MQPDTLNIDKSFRGDIFAPGTTLTGTVVKCSFYLATLNGVNITNAKFFSCNFITATIRCSVLRDSTFSHCAFIGASFKKSDMFNVDFIVCDFKGASLFEIRGTTTCRFPLSNRSLLETNTDLTIKELPDRDRYLVCPAILSDAYLEREMAMPPMRNAVNVIGFQPTQRKVPRRTGAQSQLLLPPAKMIDAVALPKVDHYRSAPQKIPLSKKPSEYQAQYSVYDEEDYGCHYMRGVYGGGAPGTGRQHPGTYTVTKNAEYKYGYMNNGVLECSDLEEYAECPG